MSKHAVRASAGESRANLYDEITDKIIAELEAGRIPWVHPWGTAAAKASLAMPKNASTSRRYSGINVLILWGAVIQCGFTGQSWLTFRQALSMGGHVRRGERGTTVVYADRFVPNDEKRRAAETGDEAQAIPFLKRFTVFNTDQCVDLSAEVMAVAPPPPPAMIEPRVDALIKATGIDFPIGGNRAFMGVYRIELLGFTDPMRDRLGAYGLFHEIISWKLRMFVPSDAAGIGVLAKLLARYPIERITDREAA